MDWRVREAGQMDAEALSLVGVATFLETFAGILAGDAIIEHCRESNNTRAYSDYLNSGARAWLAELKPDAAPVGFALLTRTELPGAQPDGSDLELKRIYLLSRFHGLGIGAALMGQVLAAAREMGAARLLLGVYAGNQQAQAFYGKLGFTQIAAREFSVGSRVYDDNVLAKSLS